jgi:hypothetical protein
MPASAQGVADAAAAASNAALVALDNAGADDAVVAAAAAVADLSIGHETQAVPAERQLLQEPQNDSSVLGASAALTKCWNLGSAS